MSLYILDRNKYNEQPESTPDSLTLKNPYRGHKKVKDEDKVPGAIWEQYARQILALVLYDVENCEALRNFEPVKNSTHCIFSRMSSLWGAWDYDGRLTVGKLL